MAPLGGVGTWIQAFSGYWPRLGFWENHQGGESKPAKVCRRLLYTEDEVMKSLDMVSISFSLFFSFSRYKWSPLWTYPLFLGFGHRHLRLCTIKIMSSTPSN